MRSSTLLLVLPTVLLTSSLAAAKTGTVIETAATHSVQLTDDGRSISGAFSPDGSQVAYLSLVKHFTPEGAYYFSGRVRIWDGALTRTVAVLPDSKPRTEVERWSSSPPYGAPNWLPSSDYLLLSSNLIRLADGAQTRIGKHKRWFVMNDAWELPKADALALNDRVHGRGWRAGKMRPDDLPACVPRESEDWVYGDLWRSPSDPNQALYIGSDKHFDGCCCTLGRRKNYLGVVNLSTGKLRRLTHGSTYRIDRWRTEWSPDGKWISYVRQSFHDIDTPLRWSHLHVVRPDGTTNRRLVRDVYGEYSWVSPTRIVAAIGRAFSCDKPPSPQQLSLVDVTTGHVRRLTKGNLQHSLCDVHGDRYLVLERELSWSNCIGNLYVIRPR